MYRTNARYYWIAAILVLLLALFFIVNHAHASEHPGGAVTLQPADIKEAVCQNPPDARGVYQGCLVYTAQATTVHQTMQVIPASGIKRAVCTGPMNEDKVYLNCIVFPAGSGY
jgi:hypothetical protein